MTDSSVDKFTQVSKGLADQSVLVAFSGGVDSTVLAFLAKQSASNVLLLTIDAGALSGDEIQDIMDVARELELPHEVIEFDWLSQKHLVHNPRDRCYECKKALAALWTDVAKKHNIDIVAEGTTFSDLESFRPGEKALRELNIRSPFLDAEITKDEIRFYAMKNGLSVANKPSMACLATRFPYGTEITEKRLKMVAETEKYVRKKFGVSSVRARYHDDLVRIEVGRNERLKLFDESKLDELQEYVRYLGFTYVTIDVFGYRTGAMDES